LLDDEEERGGGAHQHAAADEPARQARRQRGPRGERARVANGGGPRQGLGAHDGVDEVGRRQVHLGVHAPARVAPEQLARSHDAGELRLQLRVSLQAPLEGARRGGGELAVGVGEQLCFGGLVEGHGACSVIGRCDGGLVGGGALDAGLTNARARAGIYR